MKKTWTIVFILATLGVLGVLYARKITIQIVGETGPAFSAPASQTPMYAGQPADPRLQVPEGYQIHIYSERTPGARDLQLSPKGTLLVSLRTQGKVVALSDKNKDGVVDEVRDVLTGLKNPHGLAFWNDQLFVAEETQISKYFWEEETLTASLEKKLFDTPDGVTLPGGGGGHQTRSIVFDAKGNMFISVGSTCNVCTQQNPFHASVLISDKDGNNIRTFSRGLRNAVFMTVHPDTDNVWVTEMSRDLLGDDIPADEINIIQEGRNFGWPLCYGNKVYDKNFGQGSAEQCELTVPPVYEIQAHSAPLGLTFIKSTQFPEDWQGDLFVAYHGSWNRSVPTGYKVVRMDVEGETITGETEFLTGFLQGKQAIGRPADVLIDPQGRLFVSDDKAGAVYIITKKP